jgi:hypothetical protein
VTAGRGGAGRPNGAPAPGDETTALRREHDALAERLAVRRSIDLVRRGAYTGFAAFIASGLAGKLAYDRWFSVRVTRFKGPPVFFIVALAVALALICAAALFGTRARRLMRAEDTAFARLRELRARLELDP